VRLVHPAQLKGSVAQGLKLLGIRELLEFKNQALAKPGSKVFTLKKALQGWAVCRDHKPFMGLRTANKKLEKGGLESFAFNGLMKVIQ
jgi:hypothetical protein